MVLDIDGTWRNALPEEITNIRWNLQRAVAPGDELVVEFRATLK